MRPRVKEWRFMLKRIRESTLALVGILIVLIGLFLWLGGKVPLLGRLPGDTQIKGKHIRVVLPLMTCVLLSVLLTVLLNLFPRR